MTCTAACAFSPLDDTGVLFYLSLPDTLNTLKLGLLDGSVDQSTLARLKVVAEGPTEGSGDVGWTLSWARSTRGRQWNWPRPASATLGKRAARSIRPF
jgi:hypothetical protein